MNACWSRSALAFLLALRFAGAGAASFEDDEEQVWQEEETTLPAFPRDDSLLPFYVSAGTSHAYFIDADSLAVGTDGVVRYALVVRTSGGATNVTFEGIRCTTLEYRLYATGRADGTWVKARAKTGEWKRIENKPINRYHAALTRDYFCPVGVAVRTPEEARQALRLGRHPDAK